MNQETSRNDLKDQIKEIRSTNSKIKQKANKAIYAIIYNSLIKYFTYKQFKFYQAQKTHLSTSKILLCLCNLFQVQLQALHESGITIESRKAYFKLLEENNYERDDFRKMIGIYSQMTNQSVTDATKQFDIE